MEFGYNPENLWIAIPLFIFSLICFIVSRKLKDN